MAAPVAPDALDELLRIASDGLTDAKFSEGFHARTGIQRAMEHGGRASDALPLLCGRRQALGAQSAPSVAPAPVNPLAELRKLDASRAEALALLDALRHAHQLAEALDAKRGDVLETPIGGSAGLEWGDRLTQAVHGLELELYGPGAPVTGGRE